ncbi:Liprin-beta [Drosophila busckii]|uniref:Liprin-beta n=1 Tax=Drosophila busckii TaxID=30019 RepID=A0A0M3QX32_DROBS|nr:liprin-beta-2 [Drosophila busckii]ALC45159.1 Liprin-beta [Drosophila busckii]
MTATAAESATEASKMLEAALQQMDGIISNSPQLQSGATTAASLTSFCERNLISATNVLSTAKTLALALQQVGLSAPAPDPVTAAIISDWLETHIPRQDSDERMRRLQRDKEGLALQYQMLAERVSEQADRIIELEGLLTEKSQQLCNKEEQLQRQMISRSALETQKLELMSALSELKLHRTALECENEVNAAAPYGSMGNLQQKSRLPDGTLAPKTPPSALRHQIKPQFHSLPRSHGGKQTSRLQTNNNNNRTLDVNANSSGKQRNVAFASNEQILIDDSVLSDGAAAHDDGNSMYSSFISQTTSTYSPKLRERSVRGLRNILGKLRRSNSSTCELTALEQADPEEFRRGGARATAGGRIEWSAQTPMFNEADKHYSSWNAQEVCNWLAQMGLGCYQENCRKWLKADPAICFFKASPVDIERELHLKLSLHRKKILLAIDDLTGKEFDLLTLKAANLDVGWVLRWLDDIGLPQYKDHFLQAKVDGRMLHRLTLEDLSHLHVSSCLHIASLRCGILCMRGMNWNAEGLIRRSTKLTDTAEEAPGTGKENVELWTAHRVMEWLKTIDLSEYAPNLRGAGVHGALMMYEPRFNADLLADLLSIPPSKSLLRRHLAMHFKELVGRIIIHAKRDAEDAPGYQPLTITAKLKPAKRSQFTLKRRKSTKGQSEVDWQDFVCPMNAMAPVLTAAGDTTIEHDGSLSSN